MSKETKSPKDKKLIRKEIAEKIAWATFNKSQLELGLMIEDHHRRVVPLSFEERELICAVWKDLEEERLLAIKEKKAAMPKKTKKTVPKKKKKSGNTEEDK
jgi:hypothetical protein|tara:strand:- start:766 stop:1068 length:303 start_codon:yes stop_codon:yes gene_type:complete